MATLYMWVGMWVGDMNDPSVLGGSYRDGGIDKAAERSNNFCYLLSGSQLEGETKNQL